MTFNRCLIAKIDNEKYNITNTIDWTYLIYLINKDDFNYVNDIKKIKLDSVSLYSLTPFHLSYKITKIMKYHLKDLKKYIITDACACIGGDTINFLKNFQYVNAIELSDLRYDFLCYNLKLYNEKNYKTYNNDCLVIIKKIKQDVVYFDLPWDGRNYKNKKSIKLNLNNLDSSIICNNIIKYCKMICFKIPNNFDIEDFKTNINIKFLEIYNLEKFKILIMFNKIESS